MRRSVAAVKGNDALERVERSAHVSQTRARKPEEVPPARLAVFSRQRRLVALPGQVHLPVRVVDLARTLLSDVIINGDTVKLLFKIPLPRVKKTSLSEASRRPSGALALLGLSFLARESLW